MENIVNTPLYNGIMDVGGILLTVFFTAWFCYYLFKKVKPFRPWGKIRRQKIDGPVGLDS